MQKNHEGTRSLKHTQIAAALVLALTFGVSVRAADRKAIEAAFNKGYDGKTVTLQTFYDGRTIQYSSAGKLLKGGRPGPWTLDAYIKVKRVRLKENELLFKGNRLYFLYSTADKKFKAGMGPKVSVSIKVDPASMNVVSIASATSKVFMGRDKKLVDLVPDYWKPILLHPDLSRIDLCEETMARMPNPSGGKSADFRRNCDPTIQNPAAGSGVTPPVPLFRPEPPYTPEARAARCQGTVVLVAAIGADGRVGKVVLLKPLGMGLDDEAVATVRTWKFKPAIRAGKPVAVAVDVMVTFRLY